MVGSVCSKPALQGLLKPELERFGCPRRVDSDPVGPAQIRQCGLYRSGRKPKLGFDLNDPAVTRFDLAASGKQKPLESGEKLLFVMPLTAAAAAVNPNFTIPMVCKLMIKPFSIYYLLVII